MIRAVAWLLSFTILLMSAKPALGVDSDQREATRALVRRGVEHFDAQDYSKACDDFVAALKVAEVPAIAWWAGRAQEKLGDYVKAAQLYTAATQMKQNDFWSDTTKQLKAQRDAAQALKAILPRVPALKIEIQNVDAAEFEIAIDGNALTSSALSVQQPLPPGEHSITLTTKDGRSLTVRVSLTENEKRTVGVDVASAVAPEPEPASPTPARIRPPTPSSRTGTPRSGHVATHQTKKRDNPRTLAWVALGFGAAGLALGTTAGLVTLFKHSSLRRDGCSSDFYCPDDISDSRFNSYNNWRKISAPSFIAGGIAVAAGFTLMLIPRKQETSAQISVTVGPNALGVVGAF